MLRLGYQSTPKDRGLNHSSSVGFPALIFGIISLAGVGLVFGMFLLHRHFDLPIRGNAIEIVGWLLLIVIPSCAIVAIVLGIVALNDKGRRDRFGIWAILMGLVVFMLGMLMPIFSTVG